MDPICQAREAGLSLREISFEPNDANLRLLVTLQISASFVYLAQIFIAWGSPLYCPS